MHVDRQVLNKSIYQLIDFLVFNHMIIVQNQHERLW